jgi:glycogen operon protein
VQADRDERAQVVVHLFTLLTPGVPYPLGATFDGRGVNFAVYSGGSRVEVCLFDEQGREQRVSLSEVTNNVWHGHWAGVRPGALYGYRVHGPWNPREGQFYNANKLLADPYALAFRGALRHRRLVTNRDGAPDADDSAPDVPKSVVVRDNFDWGHDVPPGILWRRTVIYEAHLKGLTMRHPHVPPAHRGTYLGLAAPAVIHHLKSIGVTAVELLPIQELVDDAFLVNKGLVNYWGYNTLGFFAPAQRYASKGGEGPVREFKTMVKALHAEGIEVILDIAPNHTCEAGPLGPTVCWRGLDNRAYYWLSESDRSQYRDFTGCGNSLNLANPWAHKMVIDALRHWVTEYHVDGFRFDLASTLARGLDGEFSESAPFLHTVHQDPVLSRVKLIAEPWDLGPHGYRLGHYPPSFAEWNDRYRDTVRKFWRGNEAQAPDLGFRLTGSSDLFKLSGRRPTASINFVTCHDGFTLRDLVSYERKHNDANLEENRDGNDWNHSWNCGVEGETTDATIRALRLRQQRNLMATLYLSVGTPMLNAGDELARTQRGNNNAYCQDNELSWHDWTLDDERQQFLAFVQKLASFRANQEVLQRRNFFLGQTLDDSHFHDLIWFNADGSEMQASDWKTPRHFMAWFLGGDAIGTRDPLGAKITGDSVLAYLNASSLPIQVTLPGPRCGAGPWEVILDTSLTYEGQRWAVRGAFEAPAQSVVVLTMPSAPAAKVLAPQPLR